MASIVIAAADTPSSSDDSIRPIYAYKADKKRAGDTEHTISGTEAGAESVELSAVAEKRRKSGLNK
jgi:hypothetical protein